MTAEFLHRPTCLCSRCQGHRRQLELAALRTPRVLVPSDVSVDHIAELVGQGWRLAEIAREAGLSAGVVSKTARHGYQLDASTEDAILKVALY